MTPVQIKNTARLRLATAGYPPKKLVLIYMAITLGASFLSLLLSFAVGLMVENTGGLSGLGTRAVMETVSAVFSFAVQILAPLLSMGFLYCTILLAREKQAGPKDLLTGPKRWGVILRLGLVLMLIYFVIGYLTLNVASIIFMFLPSSTSAMDSLMAMMENPAFAEGNLSPETLSQLTETFTPVYIIWAILLLVVCIPLLYRLRLANFKIMEETPTGAVKAIFQSLRLTKGNCNALFKLDLSFWWFYLLQLLLSSATSVLGLFLSDLWYMVTYGVYCLAFLWLNAKYSAYVQVSYAVFYENLQEAANAPVYPQLPPEQ